MRMLERLKGFLSNAKKLLKDNRLSVIVGSALVILVIILNLQEISYENIVETVKISVTVLISMLGFSVSIYVFLNNTFQSRRNSNELEKEVIDSFQSQKRKDLGISIVFSAMAISGECAVVAFKDQIIDLTSNANSSLNQIICIIIVVLLFAITLLNVYKLGYFTYGVINYEEGLIKLAKKEMNNYSKDKCYEKMSKGEFLNLVNNVEVLVERLIRNHLHAKISTAYDSNLKRAICDGITESGEIDTRTQLAKDYKDIIDYRNLLLQDTTAMDSKEVAMGDQVKSVMNRIFQHYLKSELLTGVNISNLVINEANLEKSSLSNSSLQNIKFIGDTNLQNTDFRDSTINSVC